MKLRPCCFATTFELLEELDARHKAFVFAALDDTGGIVFDCKGGPVELLGLGEVAAIKAGNEAADDLDDDDCGGDCVGCPMLDPGNVACDVAEAEAPAPVSIGPVIVKVEKRSPLGDMPNDITHIIVVGSVRPGDVVPDYCELRSGWTQSDIAGKKYEGSGPSGFRRGSGVVTLTPQNRGSNVELSVAHLVEVSTKVGEARPAFYFGGGKWKRSAVAGRPIESWETKNVVRRARLALPEETPFVPKTVEPTYISRLAPVPEVAFTLSAPKPKLVELTPENSGDIPEDVTHLVEVPYPGEGGIEPEFFMLRDKWNESGIAGDTIIEGGTFGDCRHARRARPEEIPAKLVAPIEVTERERGYNFPKEVTHLVEVPVNLGDALPEFFKASTGRWIRSESRGKAAVEGTGLFYRRHARRAEAHELPAPPAPQVVKIEKRTKTVPADVTHVVVEPSVGPGDIIPPLVEIDGVWGQDGSPSGSKFVGGGPSIYRRGRAATPAEAGTLIDITTNNRGLSVPSNVTHLVEVAVKAGDADPGFFKAKGSGNCLVSTSRRPLTERDTEWRCARAARPDEIPAKPAPVVEMTAVVKPFRPLVSSSIPRLGFTNGPRSIRLS